MFKQTVRLRLKNLLRHDRSRLNVVTTSVFLYARAGMRMTRTRTHRARAAATGVILLIGLMAGLSANLAQPARANAVAADTINFQARLDTNGGSIVPDGNYNVEFKLYSASSGGTALWTEDYLNSNSQGIQVFDGYLTANLGSITAFPSTIDWGQQLYLTLNIGGTGTGVGPSSTDPSAWDGEMNPRLLITAVPYAYQAKNATQLQTVNGSYTETLSFSTPTANDSIALPDASGTVCLQTSASCGFESTTGTDFIQNQDLSPQTANFDIQSSAAGSVGAVIEGAASQTADLLQLKNSSGTVRDAFNANGDLTIGGAGTGAANSTTAFQVQNTSGTSALNVDTSNMTTTLQAGTDTGTATELFTSSESFPATTGWTSISGTGSSATATHTSGGGTTALSPTPALGIVSGDGYQVTYTVTNPNNGSTLNVTMGGQTVASYSFDYNSGTFTDSNIIVASSTANLAFTPSAGFTGTISGVSVKLLTANTAPVLVINNASGSSNLQVRASSSTSNVFVGNNTGDFNVTGTYNVGFGQQALFVNTSGSDNTALGNYTLQGNTTGSYNTAVGINALTTNTAGTYDTALGMNSLFSNTIGSQDVALGSYALESNTNGMTNTAVGASTLQYNTTGYDNVALGTYALQDVTTGGNNIGIGVNALNSTTGDANIAIGKDAGETSVSGNANTTGSNNTFIGYEAGPGSTTQLQDATALGTYSTVNENNALTLGCVSGVNNCTANTLVGVDTATPGATLDVQAVSTNVGLNVNTTGTGNLLQLQGSGSNVVTVNDIGATAIQPSANTTAGLLVQPAGATNPTLDVNTQDENISIGAAAQSTDKVYISTGGYYALVVNQTGADDILDLQSGGTNVVTVNSTGATKLQPTANANAALSVYDTSSQSVLMADTNNDGVLVGDKSYCSSGSNTPVATLTVTTPGICSSVNVYDQTSASNWDYGVIQVSDTSGTDTSNPNGRALVLQPNGGDVGIGNVTSILDTTNLSATLQVAGNQLIQGDSANAFQVQNTSGTSIINVDSSSQNVQLSSGVGFDGNGISINEATTNIITNPSFEAGTSGWISYWSGSLSQVSGGLFGNYALQVTTVGGNGYTDGTSYQLPSGLATGTYTFSVYLKSPSQTPTIRLAFEGNQTDTNGGTTCTLTSSWQRCTYTTTVSSWGTGGSSSTKIDVIENTDNATAQTYLVDGAQLETGSTATTFTNTSRSAGSALFRASTDSTNAFQVQNAGSDALLTADTSNMRVTIGSGGTSTAQLYISGNLNSTPVSTTTVTGTSPGPSDTVVSGNYMYIGNQGTNELVIYNVADPSAPALVGSVGLSNIPLAVAISGHYIYSANVDGNLQIVDVSNPAAPAAVSTIGVGGSANGVTIDGNYAYVSSTANQIAAVNISNPANPVVMQDIALSQQPIALTSSGRYVYVTISNNGTNAFMDAIDTTTDSVVGTFVLSGGTSGNPNYGGSYASRDLAVQGSHAYVANVGNNAIDVFDVSNPAASNAAPIDTLSTGSISPYGVMIQGRYLYAILNTGSSSPSYLGVYGISDPSAVTQIGPLAGTNAADYGLAVQGRYAYVTNAGANTFQIFDLGGEYTQQLQIGGTETSTLQVDNGASIGGNASIQGSLTVGQSAQVSGNLGVSGSALFADLNGSTTAFQVQDATGDAILNVDTTNYVTTLYGASNSNILNVRDSQAGVNIFQIKNDTADGGLGAATLNGANGSYIDLATGGSDQWYLGQSTTSDSACPTTTNNSFWISNSASGSKCSLLITPTGQTTFQNSSNSTAAFRIQDASGTNLLSVDTQGQIVDVGRTNVPNSQTFNYTGSTQTFTVPTGVTSIDVTLYGAQGGSAVGGNTGGEGGETTGTVTVTPGETLTIEVGGAGGNASAGTGGAAGYNGGGTGNGSGTDAAGGGGGYSMIENGTTPLAIAGGGGGAGGGPGVDTGGTGGGTTGGNGSSADEPGNIGYGGTQTAGGASYGSSANGAYEQGGNGNYSGPGSCGGGGGGGGGYYGGGGGAACAGGGGGSGLAPSGGTTTNGVNTGNGQVVIQYGTATSTSLLTADSSNASVTVKSNSTTELQVQDTSGNTLFGVNALTGDTTVQGNNSTNKFQVQNASGTAVFNVDSTDNKVQLGSSTQLEWGGGSNLAVDSISGNDGTAYGGATTTASGKLGRGGDFTASSSYLSIPNNEVDLSGDWSVGMWVNLASTSGTNPRTFAMDDTTHGINLQTGYTSSTTHPYVRINGSAVEATGVTLTTATWYHIVYESSGGTITIYVNGTAYSTSSGGPTADTTSSAIGAGGGGAYPMDGYLDEVVLYNAALTSTQITGRYNSGSGTESLSGSGWDVSSVAVSQWHMDESAWGTYSTTNLYSSNGVLQTDNGFNVKTDSSTAFQVQNTSGTAILGVNTSNNTIFTTLGSGSNAFALTTSAAYTSGNLLVVENNGTAKLTVDYNGNTTIAGDLQVGGPLYQTKSSGTVASGSSTGNMTIQFPNQGQVYLLTVREFGAQSSILQTYIINVPESVVDVGWTMLSSNTYNEGGVSLSTQNGAAQYSYNASSNEELLLNVSAGTAGGTYNWWWSYVPIGNMQ